MLPQHLLVDINERRVVCRASGQTGTLLVRAMYQARGREQQRVPLFIARFTADDMYQDWDEEHQEYFRSSIVAEFATQEDLDAYVSRNYKVV